MIGHWFRGSSDTSQLHKTLRRHFDGRPLGDIVTAARVFPITSRVDVQRALEQLFAAHPGATLLGVHSAVNHDTPSLAHLFTPGPFPLDAGPLQHDEVDVGDDLPARCLKNGLWLAHAQDLPFALLLSPAMRFGQTTGVQIDLGLPAGEPGARLSEDLFRDLERRVGEGRAYRGRVISLEAQYDFRGHGGSVKVHRLHRVERDDVILPAATLALLDRNVARFVALRDRIKALRFSAKKGLLFHGPARHGEDAHDPLSRVAAAGAHHAAGDGGAGRHARRVLPPCALPAAGDARHRGRRSDCPRARGHGASRPGSAAQQAAERDGRPARGCRRALHPHHEPAGPARTGAGGAPRPHRPGHRVPAAG